jgi:hypothetical protein
MGKKSPRTLGPQKPELAASPITRKLDLACGQSPKDGFEGVDIWQGAKHVVDLQKYPWPFDDSSVSEVHCSHYCEHIPMYPSVVGKLGPQDPLFAFMDELWRILTPDGIATIIVPIARNDRAFQDPTHRRFIVEATFAYFWKDWRVANKLDHYNVQCNFMTHVAQTVSTDLNAMHPEAASRHITSYWNAVVDLHATMKAVKPAT